MPLRARLFAAVLLVSTAATAQGPNPAVPPGPLSLAMPVRPAKHDADGIYLVRLSEAAAANYTGGTAGFAATKPRPGEKLAADGNVASYAGYLENSHDRLLGEVGAAGAKLYSFRYALNGFAARLTAEQASLLARHPEVAGISRDTEHRVQTNNSPVFLGLQNPTGGLRADLKLRGEGVVIGIIDSGVAPGHPALADTEERIPRACRSHWARASWLGRWLCHAVRSDPPTELMYGPPESFSGTCQAGDGFDALDCNHKLVGARYYVDGFLARHALDPGEFLSPRDADGHGTHIATTAAGNAVTARLYGTRIGPISGIAPRARIAVYKACWLKTGERRATCTTADLARAIDDAVGDGVDILNYSVGSLETDLTAPDDIALLNALDAGVLSVVAAGNDGPQLGTIGSPSSAPWVLTVAASTQSGIRAEEAIRITEPAELAGLIPMVEASFTAPLRGRAALTAELVLADDGQALLANGAAGSRRDACEALVNAGEFADRIALVERGGCDFQAKLQRVEAAGAIAAVVYNDTGPPIEMRGDPGSVGIPAVMIGTADAEPLVDSLVAERPVTVELEKGVLVERRETGNTMALFSSRGPALSEPSFVKPDVTAPGVDILAGHTPDVSNGLKGELYQYLSGTSMSAPEAAGIAALLKEANPDWSPATLKSAMMTTAYRHVTGVDGGNAHAFDMGAGHVDANRAIAPGLVYDSAFPHYAAYLCGLDDPPLAADRCDALAAAGVPGEASGVNLPSIGIAALVSGDVVTRRVTNVGPAGTYSLDIEPPLGIDVVAEPSQISIDAGQTAEFSLTFHTEGAPLDSWAFGRLSWSDGARSVTSPLAVRPATLRAPDELRLSGAGGSAPLPTAFGYTGDYVAQVHGLRAALVLPGSVEQDPARSFSFRSDNGVSRHLINVPAAQLYARFALLDELTDGEDDLDLYLFHCPGTACTQIAESGSFTSAETIDVAFPEAGLYAVLVHGFDTDAQSGGPGAEYSLLSWSFGIDDDVGNLGVLAPAAVSSGQRSELTVDWGGLADSTRYLGAVSHNTPLGLYALTIISVDVP